MNKVNNKELLTREENLKNALEITLYNQRIKNFIRVQERVAELELGDAPYLPLIERNLEFSPTYKEELVIREDGYHIYAYETSLDHFEEFDEAKARFPAGWSLKGNTKVGLDDIIKLFPGLTGKELIQNIDYQIEQKKNNIRDYKNYGFMPWDTFGDRILHHFSNLMSKEIKCLRFLDFLD